MHDSTYNMPPKATKDVVSNLTNPAIKRFNLFLTQKKGFTFLGIKLLNFPPKINLPFTVQPLDL